MTEPSTDQFGIPLSSLRLLVSPLRLMSAALWGIVQHRAVKHYGLLEDFITAVHDNIPGVISHSERLHILMGLRAKTVLEMWNHDDLCNRHNIEPLLSKMDDLMKKDDGESQSKWKAFTQVVYSMLDNPGKLEMSDQKSLLSEFDSTFDSSLQTLVTKFFLTLDSILPVPSLDQTSLWLRLCPSVLKECEDILDQPEPLSNLLQHHKQNSTFSTGLYSSGSLPGFSDLPDQQTGQRIVLRQWKSLFLLTTKPLTSMMS
uniref:TERF1-interacting nuclear factor 2 N-terminal domain-containing protein n=1 Tax=Knipowitschia caucasica TaxID=637954 RepID=A0AAV2JPE5_KNICA